MPKLWFLEIQDLRQKKSYSPLVRHDQITDKSANNLFRWLSMSIHPKAYIVRKNDTLWSIASRLYGAQSRWQELAQLNAIADPAELRTGTSLRVPAADLRCHPVPYFTKKYDTFYGLAGEKLGDHQRWPDLAKLNQVKPIELPAGIEINVPPDFRHC